MIAYRAMLDVSRELAQQVSRLLEAGRRCRGTRKRSRALTCFRQVVLGLRWFRQDADVTALGRDHGVSRATAYRYVDEVIGVLADLAPDLHEALEQAKKQGLAYVILDGKIFSTDRCGEKTTSVKGTQIDLWYSGKAHEHGGNIQAISGPDGFPRWVADVEPGSIHDLTVAREHVLGALYWAASHLDLPTLADGDYEGAGIGMHTPIKQPAGDQTLDVDNRTYNALLRGLRCLSERGFAVLTGRWRVAGLLAHYYDLSKAAEQANQELLLVQEQLAAQEQAAAEAAAEAAEAMEVANEARSRVNAAQDLDKLAAVLSSRRDLDALSAFTSSTSPGELLGKLEAAALAAQLTGVSPQGDVALGEVEAAESVAREAQGAAESAQTAVEIGATEVERRKAELETQIRQVRDALGNLTPEQRELLTGIENYSGEVVVPAGDVGTMLEFASAQRGKPYRWGAVGPDSYDCSGLVQTAFRAAGVSVPRVSRQQATVGMQVSRGDVRPGDLVFGDVVKISAIDRIGQISVIRRVIG